MFYSARIIEGQNRFAVGNQMMCVGRMQVVVCKNGSKFRVANDAKISESNGTNATGKVGVS
jgi:hypothetical protein